MSLSYNPLWSLLEELNISKMEFAKMVNISNATLAKLGKNEAISLTTVDKICSELECKIENVVQHIPDYLLKQRKSELPLKKGSIVLTDSTTDDFSLESKFSTNLYVILDIKENVINNTNTCQYVAAPITTAPLNYLSVHFETILVNNKLIHGWVSLDLLGNIQSKYFVNVLGDVPKDVISKIDKFLASIHELFED